MTAPAARVVSPDRAPVAPAVLARLLLLHVLLLVHLHLYMLTLLLHILALVQLLLLHLLLHPAWQCSDSLLLVLLLHLLLYLHLHPLLLFLVQHPLLLFLLLHWSSSRSCSSCWPSECAPTVTAPALAARVASRIPHALQLHLLVSCACECSAAH